jgi:hypothetical protein
MLALALGFAGAVSAQSNNNSTINQTGQYNDAVVDQNGSDAQSVVTQSGDGTNLDRQNEVSVTQDGVGAFSSVSQAGSDRNEAEVIQDGDNMSIVEQTGTSLGAEVRQDGDFNNSWIYQNGNSSQVGNALNGSSAGVIQTGDNNSSLVDQDPSSYATTNVTQIGDHNNSTVIQEVTGGAGANRSSADVDQLGNNNLSNVTQTSALNNARLDATVLQDGDWNNSAVTQGGQDNEASVSQDGNYHASTVTQSGEDADATVTQTGNNQTSFVTQQDDAGASATVRQGNGVAGSAFNTSRVTQNALNADADVTQEGSYNLSEVTQGRTAGTAFQTNGQQAVINQSGDDNKSYATQTGSQGDLVVDQSGDFNTSTVVQSGFANESGDITMLTAGVDQQGSYNETTITQSGQLSSATALQTGDNNDAFITQSVNNAPNPAGGPDPTVATARIEQSGDFNVSTINQFGGDATQSARLMNATSIQAGMNNNSFISQTNSLVDASASANMVMATQNGDFGMSSIIQDGVGLSATLTQGGTNNQSTINQSFNSNSANVSQN